MLELISEINGITGTALTIKSFLDSESFLLLILHQIKLEAPTIRKKKHVSTLISIIENNEDYFLFPIQFLLPFPNNYTILIF